MQKRPASLAMAKTSASSTLRGLIALRALNRGERGDAIAQPRRALEFQPLGRFGHFARQLFAHGAAFAGEEIPRLAHQLGIIFHARFRRCRGPSSA